MSVATNGAGYHLRKRKRLEEFQMNTFQEKILIVVMVGLAAVVVVILRDLRKRRRVRRVR
jgi:hypothetical protein